jgi:GNAT superfamily N-acetyltransferase
MPNKDDVMTTRFHLREINPDSAAEINLVAERMRATLIEVEGEAAGTALYDMDWLQARVRWHLNPVNCKGAAYLAVGEGEEEEIVGHTIVRAEVDAAGQPFGLVSTTYVLPAHRRHGVADLLLAQGEQWMQAQGLPSSATWTSSTNMKLIRLYEKHGYAGVESGDHATTGTRMVKLARQFG